MRKSLKKLIILIAGVFCIFLGLIGIILPLIPGYIFIPVGVVLLALLFPPVQSFIDRLETRRPRIHTLVKKAQKRVERVVGSLE